MRCTTCGSPKHQAAECDRFARPEPKTRCPGCRKPVTAEELELHRADGCARHNKPVVNHGRTDSRRAG